jgi:N6-L-threonylcarbamoyladenine synthase
VVIAGGVGANQLLRQRLKENLQAEVFYPRLEFCTDNAAMVALAGYYHLKAGQRDDLKITVKSRWPLAL